MYIKLTTALLLLLLSNIVYSKPLPIITLKCVNVSGYKTEAERQFLSAASGGGDIYNINLTFIGKKPSKSLIDKALRECLQVAIKLDNRKDILANAWYRVSTKSNPYDDDNISPYGSLKYISYTAAKKTIDINSINLQKK